MAVENEVQNAELAYLLFPFEQYANLNGKPLVGGHIEVYQAGTDTKYITYQDWDGDVNPFKIPIPADGRIVALADPSLTYDVYVYDSFNNLVCSRLNIQCNVPGEINLSGVDTYVRNTDGTLDVSLQTSGNNRRVFTVNTKNKLLDVQEPLYFVENSETATIIGFDESGNYATTAYVGDAIASSISSKVDITAFNEEITNITNNITALSADVDGKMDVSKLEYNSHDEISGYDGTAFAGGQGDPEVNDLVHANSAAWNEVSAKLDATAFNPNEFYPSTNPSGFINKTSADELYQPIGDYASATDLTAYQTIEGMTAYQPSGDYATHDDLTAYQPSGDYATHDDLTAYQPVSSMTGYQSAGDYATHDDLTAYQPASGMTAYQLSGDYATNTDLQAVSAEVSGKQDKLTIWPVAAGDNIKIEESGNQIVISTNLTGTDYVERDEFTAFSATTNEHIEYISAALSGEYELSAGSGIDITDYPNEQKTVISVTAESTPVTAIEQMIESATSGKADSAHVIEYRYTPDSDPIYASFGSLINVNRISGSALDINSGSLMVSSIVTATPNNFVAAGLTAGYGGSFTIRCYPEVFSGGNLTGFTFSSQNTDLGTAKLTTAAGNAIVQMPSPKFEAKNVSGAGFSIEGSGAKGYDHNGNVVWDTTKPAKLIGWANYQGTAIDPRAAGINGGIIATVYPDNIPNNMQLSSAPYTYMNGYGVFCCYPDGTQLSLDTSTRSISLVATTTSASATMNADDVSYNKYNDETFATDVWSLTGSVQKREIECDADTSAITSIAGSAIGGGVPQSAFDELKQSYDALSALFATYSGQWLLPNEGEE